MNVKNRLRINPQEIREASPVLKIKTRKGTA